MLNAPKTLPVKKIHLANPRGFCAGVDRAIEMVELALKKWGRPVYVRHEIVHNKHVVNDLKNKGAVFVEELKDCPFGSTCNFFCAWCAEVSTRRGREKANDIRRRHLSASNESS